MQGVNLNQSNSFPYDEGMANSSYQFTRGTNFSESIFNRTSRGPRIDPSAPTEESTSLTLYCVVFIGFAGSLANGVVLFAFLDKNLRKQTKNVLLIAQVFFDFLSCVLMTVSYIVKIPIANDSRNQLVVTWGRAVCILFVGDGLFYVAANCTAANLAMIALERYFKIVHPIGHRNHFRRYRLIELCVYEYLFTWWNKRGKSVWKRKRERESVNMNSWVRQFYKLPHSCPRVGWTCGSGRVTVLPDFGGSGQHLGFFSFVMNICRCLNQYESLNTTFELIVFLQYLIYIIIK